jgi:hypothetical protein
MRLRILAAVCLGVLALTSCEDSNVSGIVVGPLVGPRVQESQLALDIVDGAPLGITDIFVIGEYVNLWVHWIDLDPPHRVDVKWYDSLGAVFETGVDLTQNVSEQVTIFTLEMSEFAPVGRWEVEVYMDDELMRSHIFIVVDAVIS